MQYVGQHGLRNLNGASGESTLITSFEVPHSSEGPTTNAISGYFEAPVDGKYKFHMTCSRNCDLYLSGVDIGELAEPEPEVSHEVVTELVVETESEETETVADEA